MKKVLTYRMILFFTGLFQDKKFVSIIRKCIFAEDEKLRWVYGCTCSPFEKKFVESLALDSDYIQHERGSSFVVEIFFLKVFMKE